MAINNMALIARDLDKIEIALRMLNEAHEIAPLNIEIIKNIANIQLQLGDPISAELKLRSALSLSPNVVDISLLLAQALYEQEKFTDAKKTLKRLLKRDKSNPDILFKLGMNCAKERNFEKSVYYLSKALDAEPHNTTILNRLAEQYILLNMIKKAESLLSLSIKTNPFNAEALSLQAVLFNLSHDKESLVSLYSYNDLLRVEQVSVSERYGSIEAFNNELLTLLKNNVKMLDESPGKATTNGMQSRSINAIQDAVMVEMNALIGKAYEAAVAGCQKLPGHIFSLEIPKNYKIDSWAVNLKSGGFQLPHIHPAGWLSGCYYLKLPSCIGSDSQSQAGWLEFGRPEEKYGITDPLATSAYQPIEGEMVTFPSYFWHRTVPFSSAEGRVSIAFDIHPI